MFRFVYYEALVRSLKQLGVRNDIADFDALKLEKGKQTLYGLIETASLILATTGVSKFEIQYSINNISKSKQIRPSLSRERDQVFLLHLNLCRRGGYKAKFLETSFPKMLQSHQLWMTLQPKLRGKT